MNKNIVLYSTGCTNCKQLKLLLTKNNIKFSENNSVDEMIKLGFDRVPVLCVDGLNMNFDEAKKWINNNKGETV